MLWKRRKTPRLQSIVQHGGRRHPLRATKAMPTPFKAFGWKILSSKCLARSWHCFSWRMQQPCTAGTPKKKGACRRLAWLQRQTGFWTQQKDASTNHKQLTSKLLSCELLIVCTCKLLLQSSKIFRRTWTLHLCPVWATADCESVNMCFLCSAVSKLWHVKIMYMEAYMSRRAFEGLSWQEASQTTQNPLNENPLNLEPLIKGKTHWIYLN